MHNYSIPESLDKEIEELNKLIKEYKQGKVDPVEIKAHRVPFGVYEQRTDETYMVRIRCGASILTPAQLEKVAALAKQYGDGKIHLTTRSEVQIHGVDLEQVVTIIKELKKAGLSTRGGGGNTVRNIVSQVDAGISKDEVFDVAPYVIALTSRLCAESDSWNLPRKYKIAFSGSGEDRAFATVSDLGFIARLKDNKQGFKVYVAGGMGAKSAPGHVLYDFVPGSQVYPIARALKNLFNTYGNRKNKHAARLRFLWKELGAEEFLAKFEEEYRKVLAEGHPPFAVEELSYTGAAPELTLTGTPDERYLLWKKRYVNSQKQAGLFSILVPVELGNIRSETASALAGFTAAFGENVLRCTRDQNILLINIRENYLEHVYCFLKEHVENFNRPLVLDTTIGCAGASTCKLGICNSPALVRAINQRLERTKTDLDKAGDITIKISGCPNACALHPTADLGFFGKAVRKEGFMYPAYNVVAGAIIKDGKTELARTAGSISARDIPAFLDDFLALYAKMRPNYASFNAYFNSRGYEDIQKCLDDYQDVPHFDNDKNYYFDWGARELFSLANRGVGECSAGLFDLIELDQRNINTAKKKLANEPDPVKAQELIYQITIFAARMLLITRGVEAAGDREICTSFIEHFIDTGLVHQDYKGLIEEALQGNKAKLAAAPEKVFGLTDAVFALYQSMDNALQFVTGGLQAAAPGETAAEGTPQPEKGGTVLFKDLRGVTCPMNFVKTKLELSKIASGEVLEILIDDGQPIENVPGSVRGEGHAVIKEEKIDGYWKVTIRKA